VDRRSVGLPNAGERAPACRLVNPAPRRIGRNSLSFYCPVLTHLFRATSITAATASSTAAYSWPQSFRGQHGHLAGLASQQDFVVRGCRVIFASEQREGRGSDPRPSPPNSGAGGLIAHVGSDPVHQRSAWHQVRLSSITSKSRVSSRNFLRRPQSNCCGICKPGISLLLRR
jgi:hypothetical protein